MTDLIALLVAVVVCGWMIVNVIVGIIVLATKQLVRADRGIALYFIFAAIVAAATIAFLGVRLVETSGLIGDWNAVAEEVREADGD